MMSFCQRNYLIYVVSFVVLLMHPSRSRVFTRRLVDDSPPTYDQLEIYAPPADLRSHSGHIPAVIRSPSAMPLDVDGLSVYVKSKRYGFEGRRHIRSLNLPKLFPDGRGVQVLFVIGDQDGENTGDHDIDKDLLHQEVEKYDDFLIGDFVDVYENLPRKSYCALNHFANHGGPSQLLYIDDDVDPQITADMFDRIREEDENSIVCMGNFLHRTKPFRNKDNKHRVSRSDWSLKMWPTYCAGNCYTMSKRAAQDVVKEISGRQESKLRSEDINLTGLFRELALIDIRHEPNVCNFHSSSLGE